MITTTSYSNQTAYSAATARPSTQTDSAYSEAAEYQQKQADAATALPADADASETTADSLPSNASINFQGKLIALSSLQGGRLVPQATPVWELPEDEYQDYMQTQRSHADTWKRGLEIGHSQAPDMSDDPRLKTYATVVVGGKVVATIDNQGVTATDNALGQRLKNLLLGEVNGTNGPDLAQARAEQLADLLGGTIVLADTALDQSSFERLPSLQAQIDVDAMTADPAYGELQDLYAHLDDMAAKREQYLGQTA